MSSSSNPKKKKKKTPQSSPHTPTVVNSPESQPPSPSLVLLANDRKSPAPKSPTHISSGGPSPTSATFKRFYISPLMGTQASHTSSERVYMHVTAMQMLKLSLGDLVLVVPVLEAEPQVSGVHGHPKVSLAVVWPFSASMGSKECVQVSPAVLDRLGVGVGDAVEIQKPPAPPIEATAISLRCEHQSPILNGVSAKVFLAKSLVGRHLLPGNIFSVPLLGSPHTFVVDTLEPALPTHPASPHISFSKDSAPYPSTQPYRITSRTSILVKESSKPPAVPSASQNDETESTPTDTTYTPRTYDDIGGLKAAVRSVREVVELPLRAPEKFAAFGIVPPKGVLLYGPPGTGKTLIARVAAQQSGAAFFGINAPEIVSKYYGESEARLREVFRRAARASPALVFIDEIDAIAAKREASQSEVEKRIVATLLTLMDGITTPASDSAVDQSQPPPRIVVLAATNRPHALDPALRRPGRFDREIEIGIPNESERYEILCVHLRKVPHCLSETDIRQIAAVAHGYVGADLAALCKEAALHALQRMLSRGDSESGHTDVVTVDDMHTAFKTIRPSAMREIVLDVPHVRWSDIGGNEAIKQRLREAVEWPLRHREAFTRLGIRPPRGVLLYGPPGCSKTMLAKALATEGGVNFIAVKGPELFSKWVGESERALREVFRKARVAAPSIVFFDEIDSLGVKRSEGEGGGGVTERVLATLLNEMDGVEALKDVVVVAATNRPDLIDAALLRPGRFDRVLYVGPPDAVARMEILKVSLRETPLASNVDLNTLAARTEGFSGAEIAALCREASLAALQDDINAAMVGAEHFEKALERIRPRITAEMIQFYLQWQEKQ